MGQLLSRSLLALQVFLSLVGFQPERFLLFQPLDVSCFQLVQVLQLSLFALHLRQLLLL